MRNHNIFVAQRGSCYYRTLHFLFEAGLCGFLMTMLMMNHYMYIVVEASESSFYDNHVRSMIYHGENRRELLIPVYVADFGNPIEVLKGGNLMYPPFDNNNEADADNDDDGYLCTLPKSFDKIPKLTEEEVSSRYYNPISIGLLVKYGGNCTTQQKAEVLYEIQHNYYPNINMLLIYNPRPPPDMYDYYHQPTLLLADEYPVSNIFNKIAILYIKYDDGIKIISEMDYQIEINTFRNETNKTPYFNPVLYDDHNNNGNSSSTSTWSFSFIISGQSDTFDDNYNNNGYSYRGNDNNNDVNPVSFFWFRFVLFGLLIIAPCIRAIYLWYAGGGRIYIRRNEVTGRIIGLQYIPPIASWLAMGPNTRIPSTTNTNNRDVISEEEFNKLPEILYMEPIISTNTTTTPKHNTAEDDHYHAITPTTSDDSYILEHPSNSGSSKANAESQVHDDDMDNNIIINDSNEHDDDVLNTSFNSAAEKGILGIVDDNTIPSLNGSIQPKNKCINVTQAPSARNVTTTTNNIDALNDLILANSSSTLVTTTCTTCSICIEDFIIRETLTFLPRCKHAFHKSCIRPWLMERQGCCPLCKTSVLPDDDNEGAVPMNPTNNIDNNNNNNNNNYEELAEPSPLNETDIDLDITTTTAPTTATTLIELRSNR